MLESKWSHMFPHIESTRAVWYYAFTGKRSQMIYYVLVAFRTVKENSGSTLFTSIYIFYLFLPIYVHCLFIFPIWWRIDNNGITPVETKAKNKVIKSFQIYHVYPFSPLSFSSAPFRNNSSICVANCHRRFQLSIVTWVDSLFVVFKQFIFIIKLYLF